MAIATTSLVTIFISFTKIVMINWTLIKRDDLALESQWRFAFAQIDRLELD